VDKEQEHRGVLGNILLFPDGEADSSIGHHARFHRSNLAYNISDFNVYPSLEQFKLVAPFYPQQVWLPCWEVASK